MNDSLSTASLTLCGGRARSYFVARCISFPLSGGAACDAVSAWVTRRRGSLVVRMTRRYALESRNSHFQAPVRTRAVCAVTARAPLQPLARLTWRCICYERPDRAACCKQNLATASSRPVADDGCVPYIHTRSSGSRHKATNGVAEYRSMSYSKKSAALARHSACECQPRKPHELAHARKAARRRGAACMMNAVSYTHLPLPTILLV